MSEITQNTSINLKKIELLHSSINPQPEVNFEPKEFKFEISSEIKWEPKAHLAYVITKVSISADDFAGILGEVKAACIFQVLLDKHSNTLPNKIKETLNIVSVSTLRGIMFERFRGTHLHNAFLPIVDPTSFAGIGS